MILKNITQFRFCALTHANRMMLVNKYLDLERDIPINMVGGTNRQREQSKASLELRKYTNTINSLKKYIQEVRRCYHWAEM